MENKIAARLWTYLSPVIIVTGLVGNVLTLITFLNKRSKKTSFTVLLAALAIADIAVLSSSIFQVWVRYAFDIHVENSGVFWCKVYWYFAYVPPHISVWLVSALTAERTYSVYFPTKVKVFCVPKTGLIIVSIIVAVLLIADGHLLFGYTLVKIGNTTVCSFTNLEFEEFYLHIITWIDLGFFFILPATVIVILNIATVVRYSKSTIVQSAISKDKSRQLLRMTFLVSTAFIVLYSPGPVYMIVRPWIFGMSDISLSVLENPTDEVIIAVLFNLLLVIHAINFMLYVFSDKRFRNELRNALCRSLSTVHPVAEHGNIQNPWITPTRTMSSA